MKDILGQELQVGDRVIVSRSWGRSASRLQLGTIADYTPKGFVVIWDKHGTRTLIQVGGFLKLTHMSIDLAKQALSSEESAVVANRTRNAGPDTSVASSNLVSSAEVGPFGTNSYHYEDVQSDAT